MMGYICPGCKKELKLLKYCPECQRQFTGDDYDEDVKRLNSRLTSAMENRTSIREDMNVLVERVKVLEEGQILQNKARDKSLTPKQKAILQLFEARKTIKEMATALEITEHEARRLLRRAQRSRGP